VDIVNDVLDYSKLESGFIDTVVEDSNLQDVLNNTVRSINVMGKKRNVHVRTIYDPRIPEYCKTDSRRLRQILYNLLGNAIKFSKEGGTVELRVDIASFLSGSSDMDNNTDTYIDNSTVDENDDDDLFESDDHIRFRVKDFGRGIRKEDLREIFKPFSQAGRDTSSVYGGTGLGLATTKKLVHSLGGKISVKSEFGSWSEFTVELPLRGAALFDTDQVVARLQNANILLVGPPGDECTRTAELFGRFHTKADYFKDLTEIASQDALTGSKSSLCLVHEQVYNKNSFVSLGNRAVLLTYGPTYSVKESRFHFRSLTEILPSVLLSQLADSLEQIQASSAEVTAEAPLPEKSAPTTSSTSCMTRDLRFLIAEDNLVNQKVLKRILLRLGFENVDIVGDGQAAVEAEAQQEYDLIWMVRLQMICLMASLSQYRRFTVTSFYYRICKCQ
jgi:two-component system, sensor histidine kinase and response regulator